MVSVRGATQGEEAEGAAGGHVRPGDDHLGDTALAQQVCGAGAGDVGLAGAGGAEDDDLRVGPEGFQILGLAGRHRLDRWWITLFLEPGAVHADRAVINQFKSCASSLHGSTLPLDLRCRYWCALSCP
jgi:hypothetical protein